MSDLTDTIGRGHRLDPHGHGCACGKWTYRPGHEWGNIDLEGHLMHVAAVTEAQVRAQIAAEAVASDHDDAHRLLRDFAGGCGDNACPICCGGS